MEQDVVSVMGEERIFGFNTSIDTMTPQVSRSIFSDIVDKFSLNDGGPNSKFRVLRRYCAPAVNLVVVCLCNEVNEN
jgi:hypothetical protein